jgi:hypothetical protein
MVFSKWGAVPGMTAAKKAPPALDDIIMEQQHKRSKAVILQ